jgi:hypothetical protein
MIVAGVDYWKSVFSRLSVETQEFFAGFAYSTLADNIGFLFETKLVKGGLGLLGKQFKIKSISGNYSFPNRAKFS